MVVRLTDSLGLDEVSLDDEGGESSGSNGNGAHVDVLGDTLLRDVPRECRVDGLYEALEGTNFGRVLEGLQRTCVDVFKEQPFLLKIGITDPIHAKAHVDTVFAKLRRAYCDYSALPDTFTAVHDTDEYRDVLALLVLSGVARPNLLGDWRVDRGVQDEVEMEIDIKMLQILQAQRHLTVDGIAEGKRLKTLIKGPGDGRAMHARRSSTSIQVLIDGREFDLSDISEEMSIGDYLYFSVQNLLNQFVLDEYVRNETVRQFIGFLSYELMQELRQRWFENSHSNNVRNWKLKEGCCVDMNDIFVLLQRPYKWLGRKIMARDEKWIISTAVEFDGDTEMTLSSEALEMVLNYIGMSNANVQNEVEKCRIALGRQEYDSLSIHITAIEALYQEVILACGDSGLILSGMFDKWNDAFYALGRDRKEDEIFDVDQLRNAIFYEILRCKRNLELLVARLRTQVSVFTNQGGLGVDGQSMEAVFVLGDVFNERFLGSVANSIFYSGSMYRAQLRDSGRLDLNRHVPACFDAFFQGDFHDIGERFGPDSQHIILSQKGDSHQGPADFKTDATGTLLALKPGGIYGSDAVLASYTRICYVAELEAAIDESLYEFKGDVFFNHDYLLKGVLVERKSLKWPYSQSFEMSACLDAFYVMSFKDIGGVVYHSVVNDIRRKYASIVGGRVDAFKGVHTTVVEGIETELLERALINLKARYPLGSLATPVRLGCPQTLSVDEQTEWIESYYYSYIIRKLREEFGASGERLFPQGRALHDGVLADLKSPVPVLGLLDTLDVEVFRMDVCRRISSSLLEVARRDPCLNLPTGFVPDTLGVMERGDGKLYFPARQEGKPTPWNITRVVSASDLPSNDIVLDGGCKERLATKQVRCKEEARKLLDAGVRIVNIGFAGCLTDIFMREQLDLLLGCDVVEHIKVNFQDGDLQSHLRGIADRLDGCIANGLIVIIGGSYADAYDLDGGAFMNIIDEMLMRKSLAYGKRSPVRQGRVCFGYQTGFDNISNEMRFGLSTKPGAAEIGPVGITFGEHPLFSDLLPPREKQGDLTVAMTHTGYSIGYDMFSEKRQWSYELPGFSAIAHTIHTGLPVAYSDDDHNLIGMQWHPELGTVVHGERGPELAPTARAMIRQMKQLFRGGFQDVFGMDVGVVEHNFSELFDGERPLVVGSVGAHMLANLFLALVGDSDDDPERYLLNCISKQ